MGVDQSGSLALSIFKHLCSDIRSDQTSRQYRRLYETAREARVIEYIDELLQKVAGSDLEGCQNSVASRAAHL
jgi:hypothetical protein